jgi:TonB family protein
MNRLQKKCVIFSVTLHVLLVGILLFGSAFLSSEPKSETAVLLKAFDPNLIDSVTSGGSPNVTAPPPTHIAPVAPPEPPKRQEQQVQRKEPEHKRDQKPDVEVPKIHKRELLSADELKLSKPKAKPTKSLKEHDKSNDTAKEYAAAKLAAQKFERSVQNLSKELSTSTAVELPNPNGNGGPLSASYRDLVASTYNAAWSSPPGLNDDSAKVTVTVIIARDGRVVMGRIKRPSGNSAMDESIQNMLDTVTRIPEPFPEGSADQERTFVITLSLLAKR